MHAQHFRQEEAMPGDDPTGMTAELSAAFQTIEGRVGTRKKPRSLSQPNGLTQ